jgi:hypothetical protein
MTGRFIRSKKICVLYSNRFLQVSCFRLKTPPAASLFPSLEVEANSSKMVLQKELPIPRPVKPFASRVYILNAKPPIITHTYPLLEN